MTAGRALYLKILCLRQSALEIQKRTPSSREPPCSPAHHIVESRDRHTKVNMWSGHRPASSAPVPSWETTSHEPLGRALQIGWISYRGPGKCWPVWQSVRAAGAGLQPQQPHASSEGDWHEETAAEQAVSPTAGLSTFDICGSHHCQQHRGQN